MRRASVPLAARDLAVILRVDNAPLPRHPHIYRAVVLRPRRATKFPVPKPTHTLRLTSRRIALFCRLRISLPRPPQHVPRRTYPTHDRVATAFICLPSVLSVSTIFPHTTNILPVALALVSSCESPSTILLLDTVFSE
ncbi:hypothetical protein B0H19DRAFT_1275215 [Mycena capillaripes]|nr:hypothetical protein B0H19DRAFT_1275215 [Mycena capillaripes]